MEIANEDRPSKKAATNILLPQVNVWVVGGAMRWKDFIRSKLADEIRLSVLPIILGEGKQFFEQLSQEQTLHLKDVTAYKSGMVELWYELRK